jgi:hypothetical protein
VYIVLATGGRAFTTRRPIHQRLAAIKATHPGEILVLRHGACPAGADKICHQVGKELGYRLDPHRAHWNGPCDHYCHPHHRLLDRIGRSYCPDAGKRRNQHMIDLEPRPNECIAFPAKTSPGTWHCVRAARRAGIPTWVHGEHTTPLMLPLSPEGDA